MNRDLLQCIAETLPDGGMSLARCRGNGACMEDAQCPGSANAKGYCDRFTFSCKTDCRLATDPVTTLAFDDCKPTFTCNAGTCN